MEYAFWGLLAFYLFFAAVAVWRRPFRTPSRGPRAIAVVCMAALGYGAIWPVVALMEGPSN
ncbi:MAG TPA: hypothetical protein VEY95_03510 [Azospirillaceae bacterium]|nr:hypothetical protein [Azospirillaceae bacterium]